MRVQDGNSQQEEIDIVAETDDVLPPSIENFADVQEGDIRFLEELLIDDSILFDELLDANFEENPLIPRPPPKPPDVETDAGEEISVFCESPIEIVIFQFLSLRTIKFRDRVELTTRLLSLLFVCVYDLSGIIPRD
nr:hypothetical protein [Tanacetum cinerariifolium]